MSPAPRSIRVAPLSAKVRIAATGWLISCATPAVTWPSVPSRLAWASSSRASR
jgi:hypothetical protein